MGVVSLVKKVLTGWIVRQIDSNRRLNMKGKLVEKFNHETCFNISC